MDEINGRRAGSVCHRLPAHARQRAQKRSNTPHAKTTRSAFHAADKIGVADLMVTVPSW
jgi:hypothetical protein